MTATTVNKWVIKTGPHIVSTMLWFYSFLSCFHHVSLQFMTPTTTTAIIIRAPRLCWIGEPRWLPVIVGMAEANRASRRYTTKTDSSNNNNSDNQKSTPNRAGLECHCCTVASKRGNGRGEACKPSLHDKTDASNNNKNSDNHKSTPIVLVRKAAVAGNRRNVGRGHACKPFLQQQRT